MAAPSGPRALKSFLCQTCRQRLLPTASRRPFTTTSALRADELAYLSGASRLQQRRNNNNTTTTASTGIQSVLDGEPGNLDSFLAPGAPLGGNFKRNADEKPCRLHVYATKHNTHITFCQPPKPASQTASSNISSTSASAADQKKMVDVLLSVSAGNLNFRKAARGSYDAAYQLAAFALKQIKEKGMLRGVTKIDVILRGFGAGREAVTKVILGSEGREIRGRIHAVMDATRLKLGGPRSKKPRRLG
jgi:small subunit ribosomal protein S11